MFASPGFAVRRLASFVVLGTVLLLTEACAGGSEMVSADRLAEAEQRARHAEQRADSLARVAEEKPPESLGKSKGDGRNDVLLLTTETPDRQR